MDKIRRPRWWAPKNKVNVSLGCKSLLLISDAQGLDRFVCLIYAGDKGWMEMEPRAEMITKEEKLVRTSNQKKQ